MVELFHYCDDYRVILDQLESLVPLVLQEGRDLVDLLVPREKMDDVVNR